MKSLPTAAAALEAFGTPTLVENLDLGAQLAARAAYILQLDLKFGSPRLPHPWCLWPTGEAPEVASADALPANDSIGSGR